MSVERIGTYIGEVSEQEMQNIDIALMISLQLDGNTKTAKKYQEQIKRQQEEIDGLRQQLGAAKADAAKWQQEQTQQQENTERGKEAAGDEVIRLKAERDTYKAMYEKLLEKVIA